jgi:hypothetical protein
VNSFSFLSVSIDNSLCPFDRSYVFVIEFEHVAYSPIGDLVKHYYKASKSAPFTSRECRLGEINVLVQSILLLQACKC